MLSTRLSNLVDQAKQGIRFTAKDFDRLKKDLRLPSRVEEPHYKKDDWVLRGPPVHIIDYLKFEIAQPTIAKELKEFNAALQADGNPSNWDIDLAAFYYEYSGQADDQAKSKSMDRLLTQLRNDIKQVASEWDLLGGRQNISFQDRVSRPYALWQEIKPREEECLNGRTNSKTVRRLTLGGEFSHWALLKASTAFWMFCNSGNREAYGTMPNFVWRMACRQLCCLKAMIVSDRGSMGAAGAPTVVLPHSSSRELPNWKGMGACLVRVSRPTLIWMRMTETRAESKGPFNGSCRATRSMRCPSSSRTTLSMIHSKRARGDLVRLKPTLSIFPTRPGIEVCP